MPSTCPAICLATSVPPALQREVAPGVDLGTAWQRRCIASWVRTGWRVVSINPEPEVAALAEAYPELAVRGVPGSAIAEYGRPFVWIDDLFAALESEQTTGLVGLVNSDIELRLAPAERAAVADRARDGALVIYNRSEIRHLGQASGPLYRYGYDLFVMRRSVMHRLDMRGFALGVPWWDYWMALDALISGVPVVLVQNGSARHLAHAQAWSTGNWERAIRLVVRRIGEARARLAERRAEAVQETRVDALTATAMDMLVGAIRFDANAGYMGANLNHGMGTLLGLAIVSLVERHAHRIDLAASRPAAMGIAA